MAIMLLGPVIFWVEHKDITFQGYNMKDVTSAGTSRKSSAASCEDYGAMLSYLLHEEDKDPNKPPNEPNFDQFMQNLPKEEALDETEKKPSSPVFSTGQPEELNS
jgi:hypothetical protein